MQAAGHRAKIPLALLLTGVLLTGAEVFLRALWGLGNPPLSYADPDYGYAFRPNQNLRRFGNRVFYNEHGLRSEPLRAAQPKGWLRVLCVGDSVTNGGVPTDQHETYPYLLQEILSRSRIDAEVLNASAGSWGTENQLAFLRKRGTFNAHFVVLQIGTHDLFQRASTGANVGRDPNLPDRPPLSAISELAVRYVWPRLRNLIGHRPPPATGAYIVKEADRLACLKAISGSVSLVRERKATPLILLTPDRIELQEPGLNARLHSGLFRLASQLRIPVVNMLPLFRAAAQNGELLFRDGVHPNPLGNRRIAEAVAERLRKDLHAADSTE